MQRRSQSESIKIAQQRVLARVLSMPGGLRMVRGGSLGPHFDAILTASLPGMAGVDYSNPNFEGEPTF